MKKALKILLTFMIVAVFVAASFTVPSSAATVDDESSTGRIYSEDNVKISYNNKVAYIISEFPDGEEIRGTAFIFAKNALMTSAHNIYDINHGGDAVDVTVYPGGTSNGAYSLKCQPEYDPSIKGTGIGKSWNFNKDWAILQTNANIGSKYGYFDFSQTVATNDALTITSFRDSYINAQTSENGKAVAVYSNIIYHKLSTEKSSDGSPIYKNVNGSQQVVGISSGQNSGYNFATRITEALFNKMLEYREHYHIEYNANGGYGNMKDTVVECGKESNCYLRKNLFTNGKKQFVGWKVYRAIDDMWLYTNSDNYQYWFKENQEPRGWKKAVYSDASSISDVLINNIFGDKHISVTLYAQWKNFTVKYYNANVENRGGTMPATTVYYGIETPLRSNAFIYNGYIFKGWTAYRRSDQKWCYKDPNTGNPIWYTMDDGIDKDLEYYIYNDQDVFDCESSIHDDVIEMHAKWNRINYTVHYNANGGSGTMGTTNVTYGVSTKLADNTFTNGKKEFAGWTAYRNSDQKWFCINLKSGEKKWYKEDDITLDWSKYVYSDGDIFSRETFVNNDHIHLYAQWKNFTVKYYSNGGRGVMDDTTVYYGISTPLSNNIFTNIGYSFVGWTAYRKSDKKWCYKNPTTGNPEWYTEEDGIDKGLEKYIYLNQQQMLCDSSVHEDVIQLYAEWEKTAPKNYTIYYYANGGVGTMSKTNGVYNVSTKLADNAFTNGKKKFAGWTTHRTSDNKWLYRNPKNGAQFGWYKENSQPSGWTKSTCGNGCYVKLNSEVDNDKITLYAQWK